MKEKRMHARGSFCCLYIENISMNITDVYTVICLFAADKSREATPNIREPPNFLLFFLQLHFKDSIHNPR